MTLRRRLGQFLLKRGSRAIKLCPYDRGPVNAFARHCGTFIGQAELKQSLESDSTNPKNRR